MKKITSKLIEGYKKYLIEEEKSSATVEKYVRDVNAFNCWIGSRPLEKMTVLEYKEYLIQNYMPASVNSMLSSINNFFSYNEWHNLKVKTVKTQKQIFSREEKELTKAEYHRLLTAAKNKKDERLFMLMQTVCSTGIRISELRFITVEALKQKKATINLKGKIRIIMIPDELCKMLSQYVKKHRILSGSVFVSRTGKTLDRSNIWRLMKALCNEAKVQYEKVFPHNLRHLFARTFYSIQKDIIRLADILGHSSINTTRIYTMENGEVHRRQIQRLGLLINKKTT